MSKKYTFLKIAVTLSFFTSGQAYAIDISSWEELKANRNEENITLANDVLAQGEQYPMPVSFSSTANQTIDGNYHSFSSEDTGDSGYYSLSISKNSGTLSLINLGKFSAGTAEDKTFSFTDLNGETVYKKIEASVSGWKGYFLTVSKPITVNITNSVFADNGKETNARLIHMDSASVGTLNITDSIFYNNTMANAYSVVYTNKSDLNVNNSIFYGNKNVGSGTYQGGALYSDGGKVAINNSYFIGNSANYNNSKGIGGAIYISRGTGHTIENSRFEGNSSVGGGGAVYIYYNATVDYVKDSQFIGNMHTLGDEYNGGGGLSFGGGYIRTLDNILFDGNSSAKRGGGLYIEELSNTPSSNKVVLVKDVTFTNNEAPLGGGMYFSADYGNNAKFSVRIVDPEFTSNTATKGGGLYVVNGDAAIIAENKDAVFSGNSATDGTADSNAGDDVYFQTKSYAATLFLNAAENKKITFNGTIATTKTKTNVPVIDINKSGVTYSTYAGETETVHNAGTAGEVQFNNRVGDESNISNINLYGGTLSIGQNATLNAGFTNPDGLINDNNFYVKGDSALSTANGVIGSFAPQTFEIENDITLKYLFDIDLENTVSDTLGNLENNGTLLLSGLNIISDTEQSNVKIIYSATNVGGVLDNDYVITTSTANYNVTAGNDDTGSWLLISKAAGPTGLPGAVNNGSNAYSITDGSDETIEAWKGNSLKADLTVNGNGHAFLTENNLNGIDVGSTYTLTMNNVTDIRGFNYAFSNSGTVVLTNTTVSSPIINNGTLEINDGVSFDAVSGTGEINLHTDYELSADISGNTVNVQNVQLSGLNHLSADTDLNVVGGTIELANQAAQVKTANFDANSTLSLTVNSLSDYGRLTAENITVSNGATLKVTLAQGIVSSKDEQKQILLLSANNVGFNHFPDSFENNMYQFEKADGNGTYNVSLLKTAENIVVENGGKPWIADAAKAYVDGNLFGNNSVASDIADKLTELAQNNSAALISELQSLAPTEAPLIQDQAKTDTGRLFRTVDSYLRGGRETLGLSAGDGVTSTAMWIKPYIGKSKISDNDIFSRQRSKNKGIIAGIEKEIDPYFKLGGGANYDESKITALRRHTDIRTTGGFLYGEYKLADWFINAIGSYGRSRYDENRFVLGQFVQSEHNVYTSSVAATVGHQFDDFVPEIGIRYYYIKCNEYRDSAQQLVTQSDVNYWRAVGGVRLTKNWDRIRPDIYLGLAYDLTSPKNKTFVNLINGAGYMVDEKHMPRLEYEVNAGLNVAMTDNLTFGISYMGAYRSNYQEHTGIIRLEYDIVPYD